MKRAQLTLFLLLWIGNIFAHPVSASDESHLFFIPDIDGIEGLKNYGKWVEIENQGRVWNPFVVRGWRPFHYGHWIRISSGWLWVAYEPFGWIVFHYGSWFYDRTHGWLWIPDHQWSPAQVRWFQYRTYIGWAPLPPEDIPLPQPWIAKEISYWNIVEIKNFLREKVGNFVKSNLPVAPARQQDRIFQAPELERVEGTAKKRVQQITIEDKIIDQSGFYRIVLPAEELKKVARHRGHVVKRVLKPRWDRKSSK